MKKLLSLGILISILMPPNIYALDITVGATTWYAWWDGKYEKKNQSVTGGEREFNISTDPTFLYGPALSLKFNEDFNLTFVYLYGKFEQSDFKKLSGMMGTVYDTADTIYKRTDADIALNYRLNDYLKIFAGIKYMAYKAEFSGTQSDIPYVVFIKYTGHNEPTAYGPGLGLNCTLPVIDNLFILGTLSGFYLWGKEKDYVKIIVDSSYPSVGNNLNDKFNYKEYGINSNLSIAYYITSISTVISLGGRLQYFKTDCGDIKNLLTFIPNGISTTILSNNNNIIYNGNKTHKIYGITLTATYTFSI